MRRMRTSPSSSSCSPASIPSVPDSFAQIMYFTSPISIPLTFRSTEVWHGKRSSLFFPPLCLINSLTRTLSLHLSIISRTPTPSSLSLPPSLSLSVSHPLLLSPSPLFLPCCWPPHTQHLHMLLFNIWSAPSCLQHQRLHGINNVCLHLIASQHASAVRNYAQNLWEAAALFICKLLAVIDASVKCGCFWPSRTDPAHFLYIFTTKQLGRWRFCSCSVVNNHLSKRESLGCFRRNQNLWFTVRWGACRSEKRQQGKADVNDACGGWLQTI